MVDVSFERRKQQAQVQGKKPHLMISESVCLVFHLEMLLLFNSLLTVNEVWGFLKANPPLVLQTCIDPGLSAPLAHCEHSKKITTATALGVWVDGSIYIKGPLSSFGLYIPLRVRLLLPLNIPLGDKRIKSKKFLGFWL